MLPVKFKSFIDTLVKIKKGLAALYFYITVRLVVFFPINSKAEDGHC
jgi:hypothetical protein